MRIKQALNRAEGKATNKAYKIISYSLFQLSRKRPFTESIHSAVGKEQTREITSLIHGVCFKRS